MENLGSFLNKKQIEKARAINTKARTLKEIGLCVKWVPDDVLLSHG